MHLLQRLKAAVRAFNDYTPAPSLPPGWDGIEFQLDPDPLRFRTDERGHAEPVIAHRTIGSGDDEEERVITDLDAFHASRRTIHAAANPCHHGKLSGECCPACIAINRLS